MILECPSCRARYIVPIGQFAQGGRTVRCARCKEQWHATLPRTIDVFTPLPPSVPAVAPPFASAPASPLTKDEPSPSIQQTIVANLPAVIANADWRRQGGRVALIMAGIVALILLPVLSRQQIVRIMPLLRSGYEFFGLSIDHSGNGLIFDHVTSELRYDSGMMHLYVDGTVHNETTATQLVPDIRARALGPDSRVIQSWWVAAPTATLAGGADAPFHTEVNAPMTSTIREVYLEFYNRDEKGDVIQ